MIEDTHFVEKPVASTSNLDALPILTDAQISIANAQLENASPQEILEWAVASLPGLYQTTAFGLTGLVSTDMLSKISDRLAPVGQPPRHLVPLIFLDTLYHFPQTLALAERVSRKYGADLHIYTPEGCSSRKDFENRFGEEMWIHDEEAYDYLVKAEPGQRAYRELNAKAVITGRRRSQGSDRSSIPVIEKDSQGLIKVNPMANWTFKQVKDYIDANKVPYNSLLDEGYKSIGDWHSTKKSDGSVAKDIIADGDERAGRWAGRQEKTECGLHKDFFKMKMAFQKKQRENEQAARDAARDQEPVLIDLTPTITA